MSILGEIYPYVWMSALTVYLLVYGCKYFLNQFYYPSRYSEKHQRKLLIKTLQKLGCRSELGDDEIKVIYAPRKHFVLRFREQLVWIYYSYWGECDLSTTPQNEVARLKECINLSNKESSYHIIYTEKGHILYLHSLIAVYFSDVIPDIATYLQSTFDALLQSPYRLKEKLDECTEQQTQERVKVKGFSSTTKNDSVDASDASPVVG